jgi:hypothetical protein
MAHDGGMGAQWSRVVHLRVLGALAGVAVLAACGGGGGSGKPAGQPATAEGLEAFVRDAAPKLMTGDDGTYELLSAECRSTLTEADWKGQLAMATGFLKALGMDGDSLSVGTVETRNVSSTEGEASVELLVDGKPFGEDEGMTSTPSFDRYVYEDGGWRITDCEGLGGAGDTEAGGPADGEPGSRSEPLAVGTAATVGDYEVTVLSVVPDATTEILEAQGYGDLPEGGNVHALVRLAVTYTGADEGSPGFDLRVGMAGPDNRSYDSCEVSPPESMFDEPDLLTGGQAEGTFCVTLPGDQAVEGLVFVEPAMTFDGAKTWWKQA